MITALNWLTDRIETKIQAAITPFEFDSGEFCGLLHSLATRYATGLLRFSCEHLSTSAVLCDHWVFFSADHTACCLSVTLCIVAKRYILVSEQVK